MKILAIDRSGLFFGSAYNLIEWAERYVQCGIDVTLLLSEEGEFRKEAEKAGIKVECVPLPAKLNAYGKKNLKWTRILMLIHAWISYNLLLCRTYKNKDYDLFVANNYRTYVYFFIFILYLKLSRAKTSLRLQSSDTPLRVFKYLSPWVFTKIFIIGTRQYAIRNFGIKYVENSNVHPVPNPVDIKKFKPDRTNITSIREEIGVPEDAVVFISVSYIEPRKGVLELVEVFSRLSDRNIYLVHVGDAASHVDYEKRVRDIAAKNVVFLGRRRDIPSLLNAADAFVLFSEYEGMPYVILEAMACGLPVLASDVGSNREVLKGVGSVVDWGDQDSLQKEVIRFAENDSDLPIPDVLQKVRNEYSLDSYFARLDSLFGINDHVKVNLSNYESRH